MFVWSLCARICFPVSMWYHWEPTPLPGFNTKFPELMASQDMCRVTVSPLCLPGSVPCHCEPHEPPHSLQDHYMDYILWGHCWATVEPCGPFWLHDRESSRPLYESLWTPWASLAQWQLVEPAETFQAQSRVTMSPRWYHSFNVGSRLTLMPLSPRFLWIPNVVVWIRNNPHNLGYLITWSPFGNAIWG